MTQGVQTLVNKSTTVCLDWIAIASCERNSTQETADIRKEVVQAETIDEEIMPRDAKTINEVITPRETSILYSKRNRNSASYQSTTSSLVCLYVAMNSRSYVSASVAILAQKLSCPVAVSL